MKKKEKLPEELLEEEIRRLGQTHGLNEVFTTFLELTALSLAMEMDPIHAAERKTRYEELEGKLDQDTLSAYGRMCLYITLAICQHRDEPSDILGELYHRLKLNNEWNGQFFTPDNVCRMMGMMACSSAAIPEDGYLTLSEPACGSGAMVLGASYSMQKERPDFREHVMWLAQDLDIRCVWMAYIQLCLYGIPAAVMHGNTLTMEEYSRWYTGAAYAHLTFREEQTGDSSLTEGGAAEEQEAPDITMPEALAEAG